MAPGGVGGASGQAAAHVYGWVRMTALEGGRDWQRRARSLPRPPFVRVSGTGDVPVRVGPSTGYTKYLTQIDRDDGWQAVLGRNGAWWQIRADATRRGWVPAALVDETGDAQAVPFVNEAPPPALAGPGGTDAPSDTAVRASGHYLNLANSWQGSWTVSKSGTQVKAAFRSSRSPVQYLARQNPADLLVLPAGFRPKATKDIRVTGVHVTETGVDYAGEPKQNFTLRVSTTGAVRYVDSSELDHTGYLRYEIGTTQSGITVSWPTATAATTETRPALPDLSGTGTYHNRQVNRGSRWSMAREGNAVEGSFTTTRSPVEYFANQNREAQVWLPREYWPNRDARFQVKGAVRVNADGTNSTDTRKVNFWITVRSRDGRMYYDRDASLKTQGVGYLRYSVNVDWNASPRVQAPSAPRDLEVDSVTATEVELAWRSPADNGGDSVDEYKVERYRNGRWRTEEDDISGTRHEVEDLSPHTRYGFRVAARNSAGWGPAGTAVSATTRRAQPGRARSLTATAAHDRVTLAWQAPSSGAAATGYRVERRVGSGTYAVVAANTGSAVTFHVDRTVQAATAYGYRVRALHHGEEGAWSSARTVTTAAAPTLPGSPTALRVEPGTASQLRLSWTAPGDTGGGVTGYRVERSPDRATRVWTVVAADTGSAETTWDEDGTLAADRAYHYRVRACNSAGASPASAEAAGRTRPRLRLDQPVRYPLTARAEPRADAAATATFARFLPERTFDLTGATGATDGWQRILSFHAARSEPLWVPMAAGSVQGVPEDLVQVPGAPAGFTATLAANHEVGLAWRAPASGAAVTGYRLWRQEDDGAWTRLGTDPAATAATHTDSTVTVGHAYRYRLQALSAEGAGVAGEAPALAVMATATAPETVRNLQATAAATGLQLSWQPAATGGLPAAYRVAWQASTATAAESVTVAGTGHALTDLRPGTEYTVRVTARNQEGEAAAASLTVSTLDAAPGTPTEVSVAVAGNGAAATWQAPATGGYATGYEVQGKARTAAWPADTTARAVRSHALTNLTFDGDYDLRVRAVNTEGRSAWVAVPFTAGPERPGAVQDLAVAPGADSRLQLSWQAPADHSVVTGYRIERAVAADPLVWTEAAPDTGSTDTVWSDSGLAAATTHHYRVTARSAAGLGTVSGGGGRPDAAAGEPQGDRRVSAEGACRPADDGAGDPHLGGVRRLGETGCGGPGCRRELVPGAALRGARRRPLLAAGRCGDGDGGHRGGARGPGPAHGAGGRGHPQPGDPDLDGTHRGRDRDRLPHLAADGRGCLHPSGDRSREHGRDPYGPGPGGGHDLHLPGAGALRRGGGAAHGGGGRNHAADTGGAGRADRPDRGPGRGQSAAVELDGPDHNRHPCPHRVSGGMVARHGAPDLVCPVRACQHHGHDLVPEQPERGHGPSLPGARGQCRGRRRALGRGKSPDAPAAGPEGGRRLPPAGPRLAGRGSPGHPHLGGTRQHGVAGHRGPGGRQRRLVPGAALRRCGPRALLAAGGGGPCNGCRHGCPGGPGPARDLQGHCDPP